jgi:hypothetical protein
MQLPPGRHGVIAEFLKQLDRMLWSSLEQGMKWFA